MSRPLIDPLPLPALITSQADALESDAVTPSEPKPQGGLSRLPPEMVQAILGQAGKIGRERWLRVSGVHYQIAAPLVAKDLAEAARNVKDYVSFRRVLKGIQGLFDRAKPIPSGVFEALVALSRRNVWRQGRANEELYTLLKDADAFNEAKICAAELEAQKRSDQLVKEAKGVTNLTDFQELLTKIEALSERPDLIQVAPLIALMARVLILPEAAKSTALLSVHAIYTEIPEKDREFVGYFPSRLGEIPFFIALHEARGGKPVGDIAREYDLDEVHAGILAVESVTHGAAGYDVATGELSHDKAMELYQLDEFNQLDSYLAFANEGRWMQRILR